MTHQECNEKLEDLLKQ